jgi:hypothetical protein
LPTPSDSMAAIPSALDVPGSDIVTVENLVYVKTNNLQFSINSDLAIFNELGDDSDTEGEASG